MAQVGRTAIARLDEHRTAGEDEYAASPPVLSDVTDFVQSDGEGDDALPVHGRGQRVPPVGLLPNWGVPRFGGVPPRVRECLPSPLPNAGSDLGHATHRLVGLKTSAPPRRAVRRSFPTMGAPPRRAERRSSWTVTARCYCGIVVAHCTGSWRRSLSSCRSIVGGPPRWPARVEGPARLLCGRAPLGASHGIRASSWPVTSQPSGAHQVFQHSRCAGRAARISHTGPSVARDSTLYGRLSLEYVPTDTSATNKKCIRTICCRIRIASRPTESV